MREMEKLEMIRREDANHMNTSDLEAQLVKYVEMLTKAGVDYADAAIIVFSARNIGAEVWSYYDYEESQNDY